MNGSVNIINIDSDSEDQFVSLLGGKKNEAVPMEVINIDCENDEIDNIIYKASDFDVQVGFTGTIIKYKNGLTIAVINNDHTRIEITSQQLNHILNEILDSYKKSAEIDWTFADCNLDLLKEIYYQFRMLLFLYSHIRNDDEMVDTLRSHKAYDTFFQYIHGFESGIYFPGEFDKIETEVEREFIRSKVPKYYKRYQTGKRKGQAYWKYGWNELMYISKDLAVSPIASNGKRFILTYGNNSLDHSFIFTFNQLIIAHVEQMSDSESKLYFPLWCRLRLIAYWSVSSKLDKIYFQNAQVVFIGPLQSFQGGSSEEIII